MALIRRSLRPAPDPVRERQIIDEYLAGVERNRREMGISTAPGQPSHGPWAHALTCRCSSCR